MARARKEAPSDQLVKQIRVVARNIGFNPDKRGDKNRLARELDAKGVTPPDGGLWMLEREGHGPSAQKLSNLLRDYIPELHERKATQEQPVVTPEPKSPAKEEPEAVVLADAGASAAKVVPVTSDEPPSPAGDAVTPPEHPATQFDEGTVKTLLEMVEWWKEGGPKVSAGFREEAPKFRRLHKDETITRSVRLPAKLLKLAESRAKKHRARTGGNLNSLIMVLLWEFCGKPTDFVEETNGE